MFCRRKIALTKINKKEAINISVYFAVGKIPVYKTWY